MINLGCRRGLSNIISSVLLVLLVIVSVGVIWVVVKSSIEDTSEQSSVLLREIINKSDETPKKSEGVYCTEDSGNYITPMTIIPMPQEINWKSCSEIILDNEWIIYADLNDNYENFTASYLQNEVLEKSGGSISLALKNLSEMPEGKKIIIGNPNLNSELSAIASEKGINVNLVKGYGQGYVLLIDENETLIFANSTTGTFYGVISLIWLLDSYNTNRFILPNVKINDWPDLEVRGFIGSGTVVVDGNEIIISTQPEVFLDYLAKHKYNLWTAIPGSYYNSSTSNFSLLKRKDFAEKRHFYSVSTLAPTTAVNSFNGNYFEGVYAQNISMKFNDSDFAEPNSLDQIAIYNLGFENNEDGNLIPDYWLFGNSKEYGFDADWYYDCQVNYTGNCSIRLDLEGTMQGTDSTEEVYSSNFNSDSIVYFYPIKNQIYFLSIWAKLDYPESNGKSPQFTVVLQNDSGSNLYTQSITVNPDYSVEQDGDWYRYTLKFSTYNDESRFYVYSRAQSTNALTLWIDDVKIFTLNEKLRNVLRTPETRLHLYSEDRTIEYQEGVDYELIETGKIMPFDIMNNSAKRTFIKRINTGNIPQNAETKVDFDYAVSLEYKNNGWNSFADDSFFDYWEDVGIRPTMTVANPDFVFINFDEIRGFNRDSRAREKNYSNYELYAYFLNEYIKRIKKYNPNVRIITWDDHHIPFHNGQIENYQVIYGGPYGKMWYALDLMDRDYENIMWWYGEDYMWKMVNGPLLYNKYGFKWYGAPSSKESNIRWWSYLSWKYGSQGMIEHVFYDDFRGVIPFANYSWNAIKSYEGECNPEHIEICNGKDDDCDNLYWLNSYTKATWATNIDEGFNLSNDPFNCGACRNICYYPRGYSSCVNGVCQFDGCYEDYSDSNNDLSDGCEEKI